MLQRRTDEERQPIRPQCAGKDDHQESHRENERKQYHGWRAGGGQSESFRIHQSSKLEEEERVGRRTFETCGHVVVFGEGERTHLHRGSRTLAAEISLL